MKKIFTLILCAAMLLSAMPALSADAQIEIYIDGQQLVARDESGSAVYPIVRDGTTYLPVRAIGQAFGRSVSWEGSTNTVYVGEQGVGTQPFSPEIKVVVDGVSVDPRDAGGNRVPIFAENGTTYLPVRAIGQAFGKEVEWDGANNRVLLTTPKSGFADGCYRVRLAGQSGYLSAVPGGDGYLPVLTDAPGSDAGLWDISSRGDGYYSFINRGTGLSIDVSAFDTSPGKAVSMYTANGGDNQLLKLIANPDGTYSFEFRHSGLMLTVQNGGTVQQAGDSTRAQSFTLEFVEASFMDRVLTSPGFAALGDMGERFRAYLYSDISFSRNVKAQAQSKLTAADYFSLDAESQSKLLRDCMQLTAYGNLWLNDIPNESGATYEITSIEYNPSYDVWRGTMKPVWIHHVRMTGDVPGQVHEFIMVSTDQNSPMIHNSIRALARFPYAIRKYIKRMVYRDDSANSFNADYANVYMRITSTYDEGTIAMLLAHELGHTLDQNCAGDSGIWDRAIAADGVAVSGYGNSNRTEDLAEYSKLFHSVKKDPKNLQIVENIYPNRTRAYKAMLYISDRVYYAEYRDSYLELNGIRTAGVEPRSLMSGGKYLLVNDSEAGSDVALSAEAGANGLWSLCPTDDGYYVAFNEMSGLCLNVPGESKTDGERIIQWNGGAGDNEKMSLIDSGDGAFKLRFKHSGLYLSVIDGRVVQSSLGTDWSFD